jgi:hypothetical protein
MTTANLGTAAYKLVLDAREFGANAVQSGRAMREVQQVMRETTTPAEKMASRYDAVTEAWKKGQIPAQNYERYLQRLNTAANQNSKAIQDMVTQYGRGMPVIGKYVGMIGRIHPAAIAATAGIAGLAAGVAALYKATRLYVSQVTAQFDKIDAVAKRAKATGFDPTSLIGIERGAALVAGVDESVTERSLAIFVRRLGEVKMGSGEAKRALDAMGLSVESLVRLSPTQALQQISDRFRLIETTAEKAATAQWLFGRAGAQLVPLLEEGGDAIAQFIQEADEMRLGFSLDEAENVERYNDAVSDLSRTWEGLWRQVAIQAAPGMAQAMEEITQMLKDPELQEAISELIRLLAAFGQAAPLYLHYAKAMVPVAADLADTALTRGTGRQAWSIGSLLWGDSSADEETAKMNEVDEALEKIQERLRIEEGLNIPEILGIEDEEEISDALKQTESLIDRYRDLIDTFGMSAREAEIYRMERDAVTDEEREAVESARRLAEELDELDAAQRSLNESVAEQDKKWKEAEREWERFMQQSERNRERAFTAAERALDKLRTPEEQYIDTVKELLDWLDLGAISLEEFTRLRQNAADEMAKEMRVGPVRVDDVEAQAFGSQEAIRDMRRQQVQQAQAARQPVTVDTQALDAEAERQRQQAMGTATPVAPSPPMTAAEVEEMLKHLKRTADNTDAFFDGPRVRIAEPV